MQLLIIGKMSEPLLSKETASIGYQKFLSDNPKAKAEVEATTQEVAEILGVELSELRLETTIRLLCQRAAELGLEDFEYLLQLSVQDEVERQRIRQAREKEISRCLGLD